MRVSYLLGASLIFGLAACGGADQTSETVSPPATSTETPTPAAAPVAAAPKGPAPQFADFAEPYKSADYNRGRRVYKQCRSCHTLKEGGPNLVGPNLYGLFKRQVGTSEGFSYSDALKAADFVWTPEKLDDWLQNPRTFIPGNKMSFSGIRKEADRNGVIAYIMSETGYEPAE